ncbi:centrosome-associated protein CEP250-like [Microcaecilia unicolor]|uniref:Centrosome-associated protein CEP250-like n=1 Tax=Microcaecilia unicolor TaxID=1415580 RepID=A0A6P7YYH4_9AMPH|nr:centrosome-associated protein CEP250-like [Microcaecilia unicolor]
MLTVVGNIQQQEEFHKVMEKGLRETAQRWVLFEAASVHALEAKQAESFKQKEGCEALLATVRAELSTESRLREEKEAEVAHLIATLKETQALNKTRLAKLQSTHQQEVRDLTDKLQQDQEQRVNLVKAEFQNARQEWQKEQEALRESIREQQALILLQKQRENKLVTSVKAELEEAKQEVKQKEVEFAKRQESIKEMGKLQKTAIGELRGSLTLVKAWLGELKGQQGSQLREVQQGYAKTAAELTMALQQTQAEVRGLRGFNEEKVIQIEYLHNGYTQRIDRVFVELQEVQGRVGYLTQRNLELETQLKELQQVQAQGAAEWAVERQQAKETTERGREALEERCRVLTLAIDVFFQDGQRRLKEL